MRAMSQARELQFESTSPEDLMTAHRRHQAVVLVTAVFLLFVRAELMLLVTAVLLLVELALQMHPAHRERHA